jgi:hypothetical protein
MKKKRAVIKEIRQKESMMEVGQSTIGNRVKESVLGSFDSCGSPFLFLEVFLSLGASNKQCRDRLGVGFVLRT